MAEVKTMRLNKVLREFNISLDRAVEYLSSKGYEVESRPTTKISSEEYQILLDEFQKDKSKKVASKEVGEEKRKEKEEIRIASERELEEKQKKIEASKKLIKAEVKLEGLKTLGKIELEGNNLGPLCAFAFGRVLCENKALRFLDLESNQLTNDGSDFKGVLEMLNFLDSNNTLTSLNLANNMLNEDCGAKLREKLETNYALIDLDYSMNSFNIDDSRAIQEYLRRNKALYDSERLKEWKERKLMREEDHLLKELFLAEQGDEEQLRMEEEAGEIREMELGDKWKKFMLETELDK